MNQPPPNQHDDASRSSRFSGNGSIGWLLALGFVLLAVALICLPRQAPVPQIPPASIDRSALAVGPRRAAMQDPAGITVEGAAQSCSGCHQIFKSNPTAESAANFHKNIQLRHGINNRCVNCHDLNNRESLTLRDGSTVSFSQTPVLCSQCHGTVFRDWERGTHGKTLGSWQMGSPDQHRLTCNECHDPHSPRYESYVPLPGPNTLRMGEQASHHAVEGKQSPLQRWMAKSGETPAAGEAAQQHGAHR